MTTPEEQPKEFKKTVKVWNPITQEVEEQEIIIDKTKLDRPTE